MGGGVEGSCAVRKKERETGGQAQFEWMLLDSGHLKAQPIKNPACLLFKKSQEMTLINMLIYLVLHAQS